MAPPPDYNDDLLLLLVTLLVADHAGIEWDEIDPYLDQLLRALEDRSFEGSDLFSRLPFPPRIIFRRLRQSVRQGPFGYGGRRMREMSDSIYGRLSERLDRIERDMDTRLKNVHQRLEEMLEQDNAERERIVLSLSTIADDLKTFEWGLSIGAQPNELRTNRSIPVRIYLSEEADDKVHQQIVDAVVAILGSFSFEKDTDLPEESGSWWKRFWARTRDIATQEEVAERLQKLERAAEVAMLDKPQAAANKDHATAIAALIRALKDSNEVCIQAGNILLLKNGSHIIARTLSPVELLALEKNQVLLKQPQLLLKKLQAMCQGDEKPEANTTPRAPSRTRPPKLRSKRKPRESGDT